MKRIPRSAVILLAASVPVIAGASGAAYVIGAHHVNPVTAKRVSAPSARETAQQSQASSGQVSNTVDGSCAFTAPDGSDATVVSFENTGDCTQATQELTDLVPGGPYWAPDSDSIDRSVATVVCSLTDNGSAVWVWDVNVNDETDPILGITASTLCSGFEQNGWVPQ